MHPEYRSRLVAKETKRDQRDALFAATSPLEAKKAVLNLAASAEFGRKNNKTTRGPRKLLFVDIKRAYFHAEARRKVYVQLPEEDASPGMCGRLDKSMYGTRERRRTGKSATPSSTLMSVSHQVCRVRV